MAPPLQGPTCPRAEQTESSKNNLTDFASAWGVSNDGTEYWRESLRSRVKWGLSAGKASPLDESKTAVSVARGLCRNE